MSGLRSLVRFMKCLKSLDLNSLPTELFILQIIHVSRMVPCALELLRQICPLHFSSVQVVLSSIFNHPILVNEALLLPLQIVPLCLLPKPTLLVIQVNLFGLYLLPQPQVTTLVLVVQIEVVFGCQRVVLDSSFLAKSLQLLPVERLLEAQFLLVRSLLEAQLFLMCMLQIIQIRTQLAFQILELKLPLYLLRLQLVAAVLLSQEEFVGQVLVLNLSHSALYFELVTAILLGHLEFVVHRVLFDLTETRTCVHVDLTLSPPCLY